jgi:hypothetical protein
MSAQACLVAVPLTNHGGARHLPIGGVIQVLLSLRSISGSGTRGGCFYEELVLKQNRFIAYD